MFRRVYAITEHLADYLEAIRPNQGVPHFFFGVGFGFGAGMLETQALKLRLAATVRGLRR
jgi:hypothetical protein